jgi:hypothetical protein
MPEPAGIWQHFCRDVNHCADEATEENDKKPETIRAPAKEVHQGDNLHDESPGEEEIAETDDGCWYHAHSGEGDSGCLSVATVVNSRNRIATPVYVNNLNA